MVSLQIRPLTCFFPALLSCRCLYNTHFWIVLWVSANIWALQVAHKESACQCRRHGLDRWAGKIPWRRKWQPTPVFLPWEIPWTEEPGGLQSMRSPKSRTVLLWSQGIRLPGCCRHRRMRVTRGGAHGACLLGWLRCPRPVSAHLLGWLSSAPPLHLSPLFLLAFLISFAAF